MLSVCLRLYETPVYCDETAKARNRPFLLEVAKCFSFKRGKVYGKISMGLLNWGLKLGWEWFPVIFAAPYLKNMAS